jgi:hypothetical protein
MNILMNEPKRKRDIGVQNVHPVPDGGSALLLPGSGKCGSDILGLGIAGVSFALGQLVDFARKPGICLKIN